MLPALTFDPAAFGDDAMAAVSSDDPAFLQPLSHLFEFSKQAAIACHRRTRHHL
jgi:hypothetical protein